MCFIYIDGIVDTSSLSCRFNRKEEAQKQNKNTDEKTLVIKQENQPKSPGCVNTDIDCLMGL